MICTPQESFLTLDEACEAMGCSPGTLRALAASGAFGYKIGKEYRFLASQLAEYARQCTSTSAAASTGSKFRLPAERLDAALAQTTCGRRSAARVRF